MGNQRLIRSAETPFRTGLPAHDRPFSLYLPATLPSDISGLDVAKITNIFEKLGYSVSTNGTLRGLSGTQNRFDYVCKKEGRRLAISALSNTGKDSEIVEIVRLRLMTLDSMPDRMIVIIKELASPEIRGLCNHYGYLLVEELPENDVYSQLELLIGLINQL